MTVAPVSSFAGLVAFVAVSPLKPGSVSTIRSSTCAGRSTPIAAAVVELHVDDHAVLQEVGRIADEIALQRDVFERLLIHEMIAVGIVVEHLHLPVVDDRALELFAGAEGPLERRSGLDVLQARANERRPLPGLTCRNSMTVQSWPSTTMVTPLRRSFDEIMGSPQYGLA